MSVRDEIARLRERHPAHEAYLDELLRLTQTFETDRLQRSLDRGGSP